MRVMLTVLYFLVYLSTLQFAASVTVSPELSDITDQCNSVVSLKTALLVCTDEEIILMPGKHHLQGDIVLNRPIFIRESSDGATPQVATSILLIDRIFSRFTLEINSIDVTNGIIELENAPLTIKASTLKVVNLNTSNGSMILSNLHLIQVNMQSYLTSMNMVDVNITDLTQTAYLFLDAPPEVVMNNIKVTGSTAFLKINNPDVVTITNVKFEKGTPYQSFFEIHCPMSAETHRVDITNVQFLNNQVVYDSTPHAYFFSFHACHSKLDTISFETTYQGTIPLLRRDIFLDGGNTQCVNTPSLPGTFLTHNAFLKVDAVEFTHGLHFGSNGGHVVISDQATIVGSSIWKKGSFGGEGVLRNDGEAVVCCMGKHGDVAFNTMLLNYGNLTIDSLGVTFTTVTNYGNIHIPEEFKPVTVEIQNVFENLGTMTLSSLHLSGKGMFVQNADSSTITFLVGRSNDGKVPMLQGDSKVSIHISSGIFMFNFKRKLRSVHNVFEYQAISGFQTLANVRVFSMDNYELALSFTTGILNLRRLNILDGFINDAFSKLTIEFPVNMTRKEQIECEAILDDLSLDTYSITCTFETHTKLTVTGPDLHLLYANANLRDLKVVDENGVLVEIAGGALIDMITTPTLDGMLLVHVYTCQTVYLMDGTSSFSFAFPHNYTIVHPDGFSLSFEQYTTTYYPPEEIAVYYNYPASINRAIIDVPVWAYPYPIRIDGSKVWRIMEGTDFTAHAISIRDCNPDPTYLTNLFWTSDKSFSNWDLYDNGDSLVIPPNVLTAGVYTFHLNTYVQEKPIVLDSIQVTVLENIIIEGSRKTFFANEPVDITLQIQSQKGYQSIHWNVTKCPNGPNFGNTRYQYIYDNGTFINVGECAFNNGTTFSLGLDKVVDQLYLPQGSIEEGEYYLTVEVVVDNIKHSRDIFFEYSNISNGIRVEIDASPVDSHHKIILRGIIDGMQEPYIDSRHSSLWIIPSDIDPSFVASPLVNSTTLILKPGALKSKDLYRFKLMTRRDALQGSADVFIRGSTAPQPGVIEITKREGEALVDIHSSGWYGPHQPFSYLFSVIDKETDIEYFLGDHQTFGVLEKWPLAFLPAHLDSVTVRVYVMNTIGESSFVDIDYAIERDNAPRPVSDIFHLLSMYESVHDYPRLRAFILSWLHYYKTWISQGVLTIEDIKPFLSQAAELLRPNSPLIYKIPSSQINSAIYIRINEKMSSLFKDTVHIHNWMNHIHTMVRSDAMDITNHKQSGLTLFKSLVHAFSSIVETLRDDHIDDMLELLDLITKRYAQGLEANEEETSFRVGNLSLYMRNITSRSIRNGDIQLNSSFTATHLPNIILDGFDDRSVIPRIIEWHGIYPYWNNTAKNTVVSVQLMGEAFNELTVDNLQKGHSINITMELSDEFKLEDINNFESYWWNKESKSWSNEGCVATNRTQNTITFSCDHLTDFTLLHYSEYPNPNAIMWIAIGVSIGAVLLVSIITVFVCILRRKKKGLYVSKEEPL